MKTGKEIIQDLWSLSDYNPMKVREAVGFLDMIERRSIDILSRRYTDIVVNKELVDVLTKQCEDHVSTLTDIIDKINKIKQIGCQEFEPSLIKQYGT